MFTIVFLFSGSLQFVSSKIQAEEERHRNLKSSGGKLTGKLMGEKVKVDLSKQRPANAKLESNPWMKRIVFFGDSMLKIPNRLFRMEKDLEDAIINGLNNQFEEDPQFGSKFYLETKYCNEAGGRMADIYAMATEYFQLWSLRGFKVPDIVVVYTETDLDDVYLTIKHNKPDATEIKARFITDYKSNLQKVIKFFKASGVKHTIIVGPTLHGPNGELPEFWPMQTYVNEFVDINNEVCTILGCIHLDTRSQYMRAIRESTRTPKNLQEFVGKKWPTGKDLTSEYGGILTFDGNHCNYAGTLLLVKMLTGALLGCNDVWRTPKAMAKYPVTRKQNVPESVAKEER